MKKYSLLGRLALVGATLFWGSSFIVLKDTLDLMQPNYLLALRFTFAGIILFAVFGRRIVRALDRETILQGAIIGICLFLAYFWQTLGLIRTTPGKNAFLTTTYCVIVPFLLWALRGPRPDKYNLLAAVLCIAGIGLVSLESNFTIDKGDIFTLLGGFFFSCHMVALSKFTGGKDPVVLTVIQFAVAAICFWTVSLTTEGVPAMPPQEALLPLTYMCVFCTAVTLLLQTFGQKYTPPSAAAILMTLESVFAIMFSLLLGREILSVRVAFGFAVIFTSVIVSETKLSFLKRSEGKMI